MPVKPSEVRYGVWRERDGEIVKNSVRGNILPAEFSDLLPRYAAINAAKAHRIAVGDKQPGRIVTLTRNQYEGYYEEWKIKRTV